MIRRNRKKRRNHGFMFPTPLAGVMVALSVLALAYVWLEARCQALGREIQAFERERAVLEKRRANEEYKWLEVKSLRNLRIVLARRGIAMSWPAVSQVVRMKESEVFGEQWDALTGHSGRLASLERIRDHE